MDELYFRNLRICRNPFASTNRSLIRMSYVENVLEGWWFVTWGGKGLNNWVVELESGYFYTLQLA